MGALNERGAAEPLVPAPSGHVRDSVVPEIIGLAADTMEGAIQAWAVGDERTRFDGFLWCGGADAGGFLAAPDRGLAADRAMSLVADRLRAVSNGADLLAGLRVASALLRRLRQRPEGAAVDSVVRAAAARARDGSDHGDALATLRGTSDADTLAVAVYVVMTHPDVGDGTAAIALAERAGDDAACVVRVLLAALHGADVDTVAPAEVTAVSQRLASGGASAGRSR